MYYDFINIYTISEIYFKYYCTEYLISVIESWIKTFFSTALYLFRESFRNIRNLQEQVNSIMQWITSKNTTETLRNIGTSIFQYRGLKHTITQLQSKLTFCSKITGLLNLDTLGQTMLTYPLIATSFLSQTVQETSSEPPPTSLKLLFHEDKTTFSSAYLANETNIMAIFL